MQQAQLKKVKAVKDVLLGSVRKSWEQGAAANALLELDFPDLSIFGTNPLAGSAEIPRSVIALALSAVYLQGDDGRLSQKIGSGTDGAALDGASAGIAVLLGANLDPDTERRAFWKAAADKQLAYILKKAPRTLSGAISHRAADREYWSDAIYMGPPFLAYYALNSNDMSLLRLAVDQCRLYRQALKQESGGGWRHIYSDDKQQFLDAGCWATGCAWAALGMVFVRRALELCSNPAEFSAEREELGVWVREILGSAFDAAERTAGHLVPNYLDAEPEETFGECAGSAAFVACAYRCATHWPSDFTLDARVERVRDAVIAGIDELGIMKPVVDPLGVTPTLVGLLSPEAQAFGLMMFAAWRDYELANAQTKGA